jgi:hypothetical protein
MKWPGVTAKMIRRARTIRRDFGYDDQKKHWTGPVERRNPAHYQQRSTTLARCVNRWCGLWISPTVTRCPHCQERQGAA